jgi:hypothetical protein
MDYDMTIHHNPDAQAWAKFFIETTKDMERDVFRDEGYMITWFANAMMAMHDYLHKTEIERLRDVLQSISNNTCCDNCQEAALVARAALKEIA